MSLIGFCEWLANTPGSIALHESLWVYPIVESVHVLTLCLFLGLTLVLDLRLLGLTFRGARVSEVAERLLPWTITGFVVMVASGSLLFYAIPVRTFQNIFFRVKLAMLILAALNVWVFTRRSTGPLPHGILTRYPPNAQGWPEGCRWLCGPVSSSRDE